MTLTSMFVIKLIIAVFVAHCIGAFPIQLTPPYIEFLVLLRTHCAIKKAKCPELRSLYSISGCREAVYSLEAEAES